MPTFQGQLTEEQIFDLIEYIKSLGAAMDNTDPRRVGRRPADAAAARSRSMAYRPDLLPNQPPAREPPRSNQSPVGETDRP